METCEEAGMTDEQYKEIRDGLLMIFVFQCVFFFILMLTVAK